jgi:hypothetical protein
MPVETDQFDVEYSQSIGDKFLVATKDRIEVYTEPGGGAKNNQARVLIHQQPINYPAGLRHFERDKYFEAQVTDVAQKVAAGKIVEKKPTLVDDEVEEGSLLETLKKVDSVPDAEPKK